MEYWPWWVSGLALAGVALTHWLVLHRQLAVSGRYTAIVNRLRYGAPDSSMTQVSQSELIAAIRQATQAEFGTAGAPPAELEEELPPPIKNESRRWTTGEHLMFLGGLALGGFTSAALAEGTRGSFWPSGALFTTMFGTHGWLGPIVLFVGGTLVGAGTRMASGCTSGHGLCGTSRLQLGSMLATAMFFGAAVATAFALNLLL